MLDFWRRPLMTTFWTGLEAGLWHTATVLNHPFLEFSPLSVHFWDSGNHTCTQNQPIPSWKLRSWTHKIMKRNNYQELVPCFWCNGLHTILNRTFPRNSLALKKLQYNNGTNKMSSKLKFPEPFHFKTSLAHRGTFTASLKKVTWLLVMDETDIQLGKELLPPSLGP